MELVFLVFCEFPIVYHKESGVVGKLPCGHTSSNVLSCPKTHEVLLVSPCHIGKAFMLPALEAHPYKGKGVPPG